MNTIRHHLVLLPLIASVSLPSHANGAGSPKTCTVNVSSSKISSLMSQYVPRGSNGRGAAGAVFVIDPSGAVHQTLFEKNSNTRQPVASTQKIVTAWVISKYSDLGRRVTFNNDDLEVDVQGGRATIRSTGKTVQVGDSPTVAQYLNTLLIESSNGAALALSRSVNGGTRAFVSLMNDQADELLRNPNSSFFQNPHGLTDTASEYRYTDSDSPQGSTANNLARLMGEFMADSNYRSTLSGAGLSDVRSGYLTKVGSTNAAGNTVVFRYPLAGNCKGYGIAAAFFGEHVSAQWQKFRDLQTALRRETGVDGSATLRATSYDPLDFTSQIRATGEF